MFCHLFHVILNINIGVCLITKILSALFFIFCPLIATPFSVLVALVFPGTMMTNEAWLKSSILGKEELKEWTKSFRWRNYVKFEVAVRPLGGRSKGERQNAQRTEGTGHSHPTCVLVIEPMRDDPSMFVTVNAGWLYVRESLPYCINGRLNISSSFILCL